MKNNLPHYRDKIKNLPVILFYENNLAEFYLVIQPRLFLKKAWAPRRSRGASPLWGGGGGIYTEWAQGTKYIIHNI